MGPNLSEDLFFAPHLILEARHQSLYLLKKFLSEALGEARSNAVFIATLKYHQPGIGYNS